ncbi:flagellar biosynthesis anti-sigma factor FlgM [Dyella jejuensis]|uniref:Negative regulator of flagellin synthesis n=1 Tax=Dyella jejuensis TaxID=1432009 RepID=A0ABW8JHD4_9GAMM
MQITSTFNPTAIPSIAAKAAEAAAPAPVSTSAPNSIRAEHDLAALRLAQDAVRQAAPDFDVSRVADIKAAMQRGEIRFDADRVAGLIMSVHGGKR